MYYETKPFQSPLYYGYRAGFFLTDRFGIEGEFTHLKVYADTGRATQISGLLQGTQINRTTRLDSVVQRFNITHGVNLTFVDLAVRRAFLKTGPSPKMLLSGRVGVGVTIPHAENEILGISNPEHYQVGRAAWQVGAGFEVRLWRRLYADGELKFTRTRQYVDIAGGTAQSLLNSTHLTAGFVWHL